MAGKHDVHFGELLRRHLSLVEGTVVSSLRRFTWRTFCDRRELINVGCLALFEAACRFDPGKGHFVDYARVCVRGKILETLIQGSMLPLSRSEARRRAKEQTIIVDPDTIDPDGEEVRRDALLAELRSLLLSLTEQERTVVVWSFGLEGNNPLSDEEIESRVKLAPGGASKIRAISIAKMRIMGEQC